MARNSVGQPKRIGLSLLFWICLRQLLSRKGRGLSIMTWVSVCGVGIGTCALVVVLSVMAGFEQDLKDKMFKGLPHLEIFAKNRLVGFSLQDLSVEEISKMFPANAGVEPFTQADVVIKHGKHIASSTLFGIDYRHGGGKLWSFNEGQSWLADSERQAVQKRLYRAESDLPGVGLGEGLARQLSATIGDRVQILNPQSRIDTILGGGDISQEFEVVEIFVTELMQYDQRYALTDLGHGRKFLIEYDETLDEHEYVSGIAVNFSDPEYVSQAVKQIEKLRGYSALTWRDTNKSLLIALWLEKFAMGTILFLIVLVAVFSISATLMITVFNRKSYISLLRCVGMPKRAVATLYIAYGSTIGGVGIICGVSLGLAICFVLQYLLGVDLPSDVYYQKKLPVKFLPLEYLVICLSAWAVSAIASLYPALYASKLDPGEGLRCL